MTPLRSKVVPPTRRTRALLLALLCSVPSLSALAANTVPTDEASAITRPTTDAGWAALEALLENEVAEMIAKRPLMQGQRRYGPIRIRLDPEMHEVTFLMTRDYLAAEDILELDLLYTDLTETVRELASPAISLNSFMFLFDGKSREYYFPDNVPMQSDVLPPLRRSSSQAGLPTVAVAAGHGLYFHHGYKDWRFQRDPSNGLLEDDLTAVYANQLASKLQRENWASVVQPRGWDSGVHEPSGEPWKRLSARYWLKRQLPGESHIWNSLPGATYALRERDEDIRSRPLYANYLKAVAAINLHSDAASSAEVSGTRVYFHKGRTEDQALAQSVLCYMRESIHSVVKYADWKIPGAASAALKHGENRLANMPSIIVELGFHTNPSDAEALQEFNFRRMAVNGIAKGWRLYAQGIGCEPLRITRIDDEQLAGGEMKRVAVSVAGHPTGMRTVWTHFKNCPPEWQWGCADTFSEAPEGEPLTVHLYCRQVSAPFVIELESTLTDNDSVVTKPFKHSLTCKPGAASTS